MEWHFVILFLAVIINNTLARPRRACPQRIAISPQPACIPKLAAPCPAYQTMDYIPNVTEPCCDQLILPPSVVELPSGLGYMPSALPIVAQFYDPALDFLPTGAFIPIATGCDCLTIAAPVSPEIAPLVKPVIL